MADKLYSLDKILYHYDDPFIDPWEFNQDAANNAAIESIFFTLKGNKDPNSIYAIQVRADKLSITDLGFFGVGSKSKIKPRVSEKQISPLSKIDDDSKQEVLFQIDKGTQGGLIRVGFKVKKQKACDCLTFHDLLAFFLLMRSRLFGTSEIYDFLRKYFGKFGSDQAEEIKRGSVYYNFLSKYISKGFFEVFASGGCQNTHCAKAFDIHFYVEADEKGQMKGKENWVSIPSGTNLTFDYDLSSKADADRFGKRGLCRIKYKRGGASVMACASCNAGFDPRACEVEFLTATTKEFYDSVYQNKYIDIDSHLLVPTPAAINEFKKRIDRAIEIEGIRDLLKNVFKTECSYHSVLTELFSKYE